MPREKPQNKGVGRTRRDRIALRERTSSEQVPSPLAAEIERLREQLARSEARIEALEKSAHEDALTGLLNRSGFERAFAQAVAYLKRLRSPPRHFRFDVVEVVGRVEGPPPRIQHIHNAFQLEGRLRPPL
mgnify:CR=1 FL=1